MPEHVTPYPDIRIPRLLKWLRHFDFPRKKGIFEQLFGERLSRQGIGWASTWAGPEWLIDCRSSCDKWMVYDRYGDSGFLKWAASSVPADGIIVDSGSNIGQFLPYFSPLVPKGKVLSFEPNSELNRWLTACLERTGLLNIELIHKGLGDAECQLELEIPVYGFSHGIWSNIVTEGGDEVVTVSRLDNELMSRDVKEVAIWKLDVEGYEIPALEGAGSYLEQQRIRGLYIELSQKNENYKKILSLMGSYRYLPFIFRGHRLVPLNARQLVQEADVLFLPQD